MDEENFATMQEEAARRVREMQRRAESYVSPAPPPEHRPPPPEPTAPPEPEPPSLSKSVGTLFDFAGIKLDEEKAMIAMLIYILYKNGADIKLLMALGYLIL